MTRDRDAKRRKKEWTLSELPAGVPHDSRWTATSPNLCVVQWRCLLEEQSNIPLWDMAKVTAWYMRQIRTKSHWHDEELDKIASKTEKWTKKKTGTLLIRETKFNRGLNSWGLSSSFPSRIWVCKSSSIYPWTALLRKENPQPSYPPATWTFAIR